MNAMTLPGRLDLSYISQKTKATLKLTNVTNLLRHDLQQQHTTQTVHTTHRTTLPTAMEMAAVTPSDKNLVIRFSSEIDKHIGFIIPLSYN